MPHCGVGATATDHLIYIKSNLSVSCVCFFFLMHGHSFEKICKKLGMWHPYTLQMVAEVSERRSSPWPCTTHAREFGTIIINKFIKLQSQITGVHAFHSMICHSWLDNSKDIRPLKTRATYPPTFSSKISGGTKPRGLQITQFHLKCDHYNGNKQLGRQVHRYACACWQTHCHS